MSHGGTALERYFADLNEDQAASIGVVIQL